MIGAAALLMLAETGASAAVDCDHMRAQPDVDFCAVRNLAEAEVRLAEQWEETAAEMKRLDAELPAGGDGLPGYYAALVEAQQAWLAYRDAECRSEGLIVRGAPAQEALEAECKAYLTELRSEQLRMPIDGGDL